MIMYQVWRQLFDTMFHVKKLVNCFWFKRIARILYLVVVRN